MRGYLTGCMQSIPGPLEGDISRKRPSPTMRIDAKAVQLAAARSLSAVALSSLLLLPTLGPVPPALADGDVRAKL